MSRLMGQLFNESPLLIWPIVSLAIFVLTFVAVFVVTMRRSTAEVELLAALPLDDDGGES